MKVKTTLVIVALLVCGASAWAGTISQAITERQLRDPKQLRPLLNDNFAEIDDRTDGTTAMDIKTDDITASGADTASLDFNYPASTNAQMATITHKSATAVANLNDNDYVRYILLNMYNSATAAVNYVYMDAEADDVTTATEDGSLDIYIEVNSTATKMFDLNAAGLAIAGIVDADSVTVNAGSGVDTASAGTQTVAAATATKLELADSGVETEVQGTLDVNGNADFDGTFTLTASALNVTNGQAVTVAAGCYVLSGIGGANDSTNTITLAAPAAAGELVYLTVATASTNLVTIADSGTVAASGAILMDFNDSCVLVAVDTSTWLLVSESDN